MGVPAFFRWLSEKYPKVLVPVLESSGGVDSVESPREADRTNGECDNLYIDMNGLIHPAAHPEGREAPGSEEEMFADVLLYVDRLVAVGRPTSLLYLAIDGVAPRAKMNQQRARRWKSAKEAAEQKEMEKSARMLVTGLDGQGSKRAEEEDNEEEDKTEFDSNVITPGTDFMTRLGTALRQGVLDRQTAGAKYWRDIAVIISDASVPCEGEHKIMAFVRALRQEPNYDPNTSHVLHGLDADLIMLALATHEIDFNILREEVLFGRAAKQYAEAARLEREAHALLLAQSRKSKHWVFEKPLQILKISTLREYLHIEFEAPMRSILHRGLRFYDFERAVDDFVFLCFFCGNDFIPHLPSLDIREGALDLLLNIYKQALPDLGGHITSDGGHISLNRLAVILKRVGAVEDIIFKRRKQSEDEDTRRKKSRSARSNASALPPPPGVKRNFSAVSSDSGSKVSEIEPVLKQSPSHTIIIDPKNVKQVKARVKQVVAENRARKLDEFALNFNDDLRLGEDGWKERYYRSPFKAADLSHGGGMNILLREYLRGLDWILRYYYEGCVSWGWYFPFHYAPFASDLAEYTQHLLSHHASSSEKTIYLHEVVSADMDVGSPLTPLEQLMAVLPAASAHALPKPCAALMKDRVNSPVGDFYPDSVDVDPNGKAMPWLHVVLLPFVDEARLLAAVRDAVAKVTDETDIRLVKQATTNGDILVIAPKGHAALLSKLNNENKSKETLAIFAGDLKPVDDDKKPQFTGIEAAVLIPPIQPPVHRSELLQGAIQPPEVLKGDERRPRPAPRLGRGAAVADLAVSSAGMNVAGQRGWGSMEPRLQKRPRHNNSHSFRRPPRQEHQARGLNHSHPLLMANQRAPPPTHWNGYTPHSPAPRGPYYNSNNQAPRHSFGHPSRGAPPPPGNYAPAYQRPYQQAYQQPYQQPYGYNYQVGPPAGNFPRQQGPAYYPQAPARPQYRGYDNMASANSIRSQLAEALKNRNKEGGNGTGR